MTCPSNVVYLADRRRSEAAPSPETLAQVPRIPGMSDAEYARLVGIVVEASQRFNAKVAAGYQLEWVKR